MKLTQAEIDAMPVEEKLELSDALWASIYATADKLPVPKWHRELLNESLGRLQTHPDEASPWPEVKARLAKNK